MRSRSLLLTLLFAVVVGPSQAQDAGITLESQCARFGLAQNASLTLHWQLLNSGVGGPYTRISHTTAALGSPSRVLIMGGIEYESAQPVVINTTIVYDPTTDTFKLPVDQIASSANPIAIDDVFTSPASRVEHASTIAGPNVVLLFGGQNAAFLNDLWRLCMSGDSTQAKWDQFVVPTTDTVSLAATPSPRIAHSIATVYENATFTGMIVYGGLSDTYEDVGNQVSLALVSRSAVQGSCNDRSPRVYWRTLNIATGSNQPDSRAYHSTASVSRIFKTQGIVCMLLFGGRSTQTNLIYGDVWRLCAAPNSTGAIESQSYQWEQLSPIGSRGPGPRYGAAIVFVDEGKIAIAGGSYTFPNDFLNDLWEFNINATQWLSLRFDAGFTPPRRGHTVTLLGDRLYLFGGRDRYSVVNQRMQVTTYAAPYCSTGLKITLCETTSTYVCVPCPAGYYLEGGTRNCLPCDVGSYSGEGAAVCTKCPAGTYNPVPSRISVSACVACPTGSFSSSVGASTASTCLPCAAGTFAASVGSSSCTSCPAGSFSNANASSCTSCGVGQWSSTAAMQCSKCSSGSYNPRNGSAVCFPCPMGFYSDQGNASCTPCPVNSFSSSISTAGLSGCGTCPTMTYTDDVGNANCKYCSSGYTLSGGSCQPCAVGTYSRGADSNGGCLPCPLHSYSKSTSGASTCSLCPPGTLTVATGSTSPSDCHPCTISTQVFDGQSCHNCSSGTYLSSTIVPSCSSCIPGTYTSSAFEASSNSGCQICPTMSIAATPSSTSCVTCPDNSFAMAAWRSCILCAPSFLSDCMIGRNGQACSSNGVCTLRGCVCGDGWTGGDCGTPSTVSVVSGTPAVLYFPYNQTYFVLTRASTTPTFDIRIKRAGSYVGDLRARVQVKDSNTSSLPSGIFPVAVSVVSGVRDTKLTFPTSAFTSSMIGSNCRVLTLELVDDNLPPSSPSMVSMDVADRTISIYFDELNGPNGGTGSSQARSIRTQYSLPGLTLSTATASIDRSVSTTLKLDPPGAASLGTLPLNFRVAIDSTGVDSAGVVDLLPATVARIQAAYSSSAGVRLSTLNADNTSSSIYQPPQQFYTATKRVVAPGVTSVVITWQWLVDRIKVTNTTQWQQEDNASRRFLVVFLGGASPPSGDTTLFATTLRQNALFAFVVLPPGQTYTSAIPSDVMQILTLSTSVTEIPQKLAAALQQRDALFTALPVSVLVDSDNLVQSSSTITGAIDASGLPTLNLSLNAMPGGVSRSTIQISIPGVTLLAVTLLEPGSSCYPQPPPESLLPMNDEAMSGWIGAWHMLSDVQWQQQWKPPLDGTGSQTMLRRYNTSSLYRTTRTSVLGMTGSGDSRRVTIERYFDGSLVAPGLNLIAKAYARHPVSSFDGVPCTMSLQLTPAVVNASVIGAQTIFTTSSDWTYIQLSSAVPFEVASMRLRLDCNTSQAVNQVEWASLGLFPDPQVACLCPRGYYYDYGECFRCPAGAYCVAGIKRECPLGSFSFGKADHCERCRDGWICLNGLVRLCDAGTYVAADSTCAICPSGFACRNGKHLICPPGMFSLPQSSDCQLCPPGSISVNAGSSSCTLCPLGTTSNFDRDHCIPCPPGETTTYRGQHPCSSCAATSFPSRTTVEVCTAR